MSLRSPISRVDIELFLQKLGATYRGTARLFLVGGTTLVYEGFRKQTLDIDLTIEVSDEDHSSLIRELRGLKLTLDINVEEVSPGEFIPLPAGYAQRHVFIGRYGLVDVFHFDPYSTALSKIDRGQRQDFSDVIALLQQHWLDWHRLEELFQSILPDMGRTSLRQDADEFRQNFATLQRLWRQAGGIL